MTVWEETRNALQDNPETYERLTGLKVINTDEDLAPVVTIAIIKGGKFYPTDEEEENDYRIQQ